MNKFFIALFFSSFTAVSQQTDVVDFLRIEAVLKTDAGSHDISGQFEVTFKILKNTESIYLDAHGAGNISSQLTL